VVDERAKLADRGLLMVASVDLGRTRDTDHHDGDDERE
jgi:hypothetical protein